MLLFKNKFSMTSFLSVAALLLTPSSLLLFANAQPCKPVETVEDFDLETYVSKPWYVHQQAVTTYSPIEQNYCVMAKYEIKESPTRLGYTVDVLNSAQDVDGNKFGGPLCAFQNDDNDSKLNVAPCFLPKFFAGPYWVVAYNEEEGYALISGGQPFIPGENGGCQTGMNSFRSGLWIFSRSPVRDEALIQKVSDIAVEAGFDISVLNDVEWEGCEIDEEVDDNGEEEEEEDQDNNGGTEEENPGDGEEEEEEDVCQDLDGTFDIWFGGPKDCDWVERRSFIRCLLYGNNCPETCDKC